MRLPILTLAAALAFMAVPASADVLTIPSDSQTREGAGSYREMPRRGMSMAQVERRFGAPVERKAAVGRPPITRWVYNGFTVYFEHRHVIESVRNEGTAAAPRREPAPPRETVIGTERWSDDPVIERGKP